MNVLAEVKITILDGEEKGAVHSFTTQGETQPQHTEIGIIEKLKLEWNHFIPYRYVDTDSFKYAEAKKNLGSVYGSNTCDTCEEPCIMYEKGMKGCKESEENI